MSRNGSGVYSLPGAYNPVTTGTPITINWANTTLADVALALTNSVASNGETTITANLPMSGYRHTGVSNAGARNDYAAAGQVQDSTFLWGGTAGGTADALTLTLTPAITAYAAGQAFEFIVGASANATTTPTLNINTVGAKTIVRKDGTACVAGDLPAGMRVRALYDGTNFRLDSPAVSVGTGKVFTASNTLTFTGTDGSTFNVGAGGTAVVAGSVTTSGLTQNTSRILGRTTASAGAVEEIAIGPGLSLSAGTLSSAGGDASTNTSTSVDSEIALFSGTGGKTLKRATATGVLKAASGVLSAATAGTDYVAPGTSTNFTKPQRPALSTETAPTANAITWDLTTDSVFRIDLNANITTFNLSGTLANLAGYQFQTLIRFNGGTTISWNANMKFAGGTAPSLTGTSGKVDALNWVVATTDGTNYYLLCTGYSQNLG